MGKEDVIPIYNRVSLSHKKNKIMPSAVAWMDLEMCTVSKLSQKKKDEYHMISFIYGL